MDNSSSLAGVTAASVMTGSLICSANYIRPQVTPFAVHGSHEFDLPLPRPALDRLLAPHCTRHRPVDFMPDQRLHIVVFCEAVSKTFTMLPDALDEIRRDTDV